MLNKINKEIEMKIQNSKLYVKVRHRDSGIWTDWLRPLSHSRKRERTEQEREERKAYYKLYYLRKKYPNYLIYNFQLVDNDRV